jgi:hypothetical protein
MNLLVVFFSLILISTSCFAQQAELSPPKVPWHHVNYWFDCEIKNEEFLSLSMEFKVEGSIDDLDLIYIAPFSTKINNTKFYGGIQTNTGGWESKSSKKIVRVGRGGIFSRWADDISSPITTDYAQGVDGTLFEAALYEGSFVSVRKKIQWSNGVYRYEIRKISDENDGKQYAWFGAFLIDVEKDLTTEVGRLRFDGTSFRLNKSIATFVESYGKNSRSIPDIKISFKSPKINNQSCNNNFVYVVYPQNRYEPYTRYANTDIDGEFVVATITKNKVEAVKKDVRLFFKK